MIARSFDPELMQQAIDSCPRQNEGVDCKAWLDNHNNVMLVDGDDVGLGTFEYPGVYILHWFFVSRGKYAKATAERLLEHFFTNYPVKAIRGLTHEDLKGARWLARQVGCTSYGFEETTTGRHELFILTKEDFMKVGMRQWAA